MSIEPPPSSGPIFMRVLTDILHEWDVHAQLCPRCTGFSKQGSTENPCATGAALVRKLLEMMN